jgi:hypothetical protein
MLVKVLNYGTNWRARFGSDPNDPHCYTRHAGYYNSTGIRCSLKVRRHWIVPGLIRFNGAGDFNPHLPIPNRSLGHTFLASNLDFLFGGNRLLLKNKMPDSTLPDWCLIVVSQDLHGRMDFADPEWRSRTAKVIAASQLRQAQEAMLPIKPGDWVKTACGLWQLSLSTGCGIGPELELHGGQVSA